MTGVVLNVLWVEPTQAGVSLNKVVIPWCKDRMNEGHKLAVEIRLAEDAKTDKQRNFYHSIVLQEISDQAAPTGKKFDMKVWKEYFRDKYLGYRTLTTTDPVTGKRVRRRVRNSSEDLGVRGYSKLIDAVMAEAATEMGVEFSVPNAESYTEGRNQLDRM